MSASITLVFHPSQFPDQVSAELIRSLRTRQVNHKFHYHSYRQTEHWIRLHQQFSPVSSDPAAAAIYGRAFEDVLRDFSAPAIHVISLGCGHGQKENQALRQWHDRKCEVIYTPMDVSAPMVMVAHRAAAHLCTKSFPMVADLVAPEGLDVIVDQQTPEGVPRLVLFFGMVPNFDPAQLRIIFSQFLRPGDQLLLSANLAPGDDYAAGVERVLPQYDNALTRAWLFIFLQDLGIESSDGKLVFSIESGEDNALLRIVAWFQFTRSLKLNVLDNQFSFAAGERLRLFFSYRYSVELLHERLSAAGLRCRSHWLSPSQEEGVWRLELTPN